MSGRIQNTYHVLRKIVVLHHGTSPRGSPDNTRRRSPSQQTRVDKRRPPAGRTTAAGCAVWALHQHDRVELLGPGCSYRQTPRRRTARSFRISKWRSAVASDVQNAPQSVRSAPPSRAAVEACRCRQSAPPADAQAPAPVGAQPRVRALPAGCFKPDFTGKYASSRPGITTDELQNRAKYTSLTTRRPPCSRNSMNACRALFRSSLTDINRGCHLRMRKEASFSKSSGVLQIDDHAAAADEKAAVRPSAAPTNVLNGWRVASVFPAVVWTLDHVREMLGVKDVLIAQAGCRCRPPSASMYLSGCGISCKHLIRQPLQLLLRKMV